MSVKRPHYYTHQFLREQDFNEEQQYHVDMRRRHNRLFHTWGVAEGLEVTRKGEREITISPGVALDREGREIVLLSAVTRDLGGLTRDSDTFITIGYGEQWDDADHHSAGGVEGYSRVSESPELAEKKKQPAEDGTVITLARVHISDVGHVGEIHTGPTVRRRALPQSPAAGWVRLPFKPYPISPVRDRETGRLVRIVSEEVAEEYGFIVDEATAYCDQRGARGSMAIPVPPQAVHLTDFRIAGRTNGAVTVHVHRTGWNLKEKVGENTRVAEVRFQDATFHRDIPINVPLDESHALAVSVFAEGETSIWLVAAKFA